MEESGENYPSDYSYLEVGDDVNDLCFDDEDLVSDEDGDSSSEAVDPIMPVTDRKRRQRELHRRFHALSATIPGSKRMDKRSILAKASRYVRQLQERVRELEQEQEQEQEQEVEWVNCDNENTIPEVKVRVLQKDVLIIVHCHKQKGITLKILSHLENLHLSVVNTSVLQFGKSTLDITIIAQKGEGYELKVDELVKSLTVLAPAPGRDDPGE